MTSNNRYSTTRRHFLQGAAGLALAGVVPAAHAAAYPDRNVRLVVAWPPGATADYFGRQFGEWLRRRTGQTVVVENISGASGALGARNIARATADGYALLSGNAPEIAINPHLTKDIGYNPLTDFEQISLLGDVPIGRLARPGGGGGHPPARGATASSPGRHRTRAGNHRSPRRDGRGARGEPGSRR